jgi:hypothetical protein
VSESLFPRQQGIVLFRPLPGDTKSAPKPVWPVVWEEGASGGAASPSPAQTQLLTELTDRQPDSQFGYGAQKGTVLAANPTLGATDLCPAQDGSR